MHKLQNCMRYIFQFALQLLFSESLWEMRSPHYEDSFFILHPCILDSNFLLIFNLFLPFKRGFSMVFFYHNKCRDGMLLCRIKNRYFPAISANLWDIKKRLSVDRENCFDLANCWVICNFTVTVFVFIHTIACFLRNGIGCGVQFWNWVSWILLKQLRSWTSGLAP